jgi:hypothetical protein
MSQELVAAVVEVKARIEEGKNRTMFITAKGMTRGAGWSDASIIIRDRHDGVYKCDFVATPPSSSLTEIATAVSAHDSVGPMGKPYPREVSVRAATNSMTVLVDIIPAV